VLALARLPALRVGLRGDAAPALDADYGRRNPFHHCGEAGHAGGLGDDRQRHARMGSGGRAEHEAEPDV
jgi:hypothetical protein